VSENFQMLPDNLPRPQDDGQAVHLSGLPLPAVTLPSTAGTAVHLHELTGRWVLYIYPMTGTPGTALPAEWDTIPGARGCTPQSCSFRDHYAELQGLSTQVYGLSTQSPADQQEAKMRLHLPFELLSDQGLKLQQSLRLPTFEVEGMTLYKRITLIVERHRIIKVFYPVFPPDQNATEVVQWLRQQGHEADL
jgi:peroxiredoxin